MIIQQASGGSPVLRIRSSPVTPGQTSPVPDTTPVARRSTWKFTHLSAGRFITVDFQRSFR